MNSNCKACRNEIEERSDGAWLSRDARTHLEACSACSGFFKQHETLRRLIGELEPVAAPSDFEFRLRARMASASNSRRAGCGLPRFAPGLVSVALAAIFVLSITAAFYFKSAPLESEISIQPSAPSTTVATVSSVDKPRINSKVGVLAAAPVEKTRVLEAEPAPRNRGRAVKPKAPGVRHEMASARRDDVLESDFRRAPVIKGSNVSLKVSAEPLQVVLRDKSGAARRVAMKSVSFGAQSLVGRLREPASASVPAHEGVW
jgi:hypothetical protein